MTTPDCCLTLIAPKALEENLLDLLLVHDALANDFTLSEVAGHGRTVAYQSNAEKVRGQARQVQMQIIIQHADAQALLNDIKQALPHVNIVYHITPITESGSLL